MAFGIEATGTNESVAATSSLTVNLTITAGNLLIVGVGYLDGQRPASVAWAPFSDNQALTLLKRQRESVNTGFAVDWWYLLSPSIKTAVVAVTMTGPVPLSAVCHSITDADLTTTFRDLTLTGDTADTEAGQADPVTVNCVSVAGDLVFDVMYAATGATADASQTVDLDSVAIGAQVGASHKTATGTSTTMSWTKDGGGTMHWSTAAISVIPGGGPAPRRFLLARH